MAAAIELLMSLMINVIDDFNREALAIDVDISLPSLRVICALDQVIEWRGKPQAIRCDNGPEYISDRLKSWSKKHNIQLKFIQPGNPQQNGSGLTIMKDLTWHLVV